MNTYQWTAAWFAFYDQKSIEAHLERMAARGWDIDRPGSYLWRFRRAEPRQVHVAVTYAAGASRFDPAPTASQLELEDLCARDGWELKARWGQMQIFYNEKEDPVPLETDPLTQVENIRRSMRKGSLPVFLLNLALAIYLLGFQIWQFRQDAGAYFSSGSSLLLSCMGLALLLESGCTLVSYLLWYRKARREAEEGRFTGVRSRRIASLLLLLLPLPLTLLAFGGTRSGRRSLLLGVVICIAVLLAGNYVTEKLKKWGASRRLNLTVSLAVIAVLQISLVIGVGVAVFRTSFFNDSDPVGTYQRLSGMEWDVYQEELPLRLEDLLETEQRDWSLEKRDSRTPLAARTEYIQWPLTQDPEVPDLRYTVTEARLPSLLPVLLKSSLAQAEDVLRDGSLLYVDHYIPVDPAPWGASAAWQRLVGDPEDTWLQSDYLLRYGNRIVDFNPRWDLTAEQMGTVGEKLAP